MIITVEAGWQIKVSTVPKLTALVHIFNLSINLVAAVYPPLITKDIIDPNYFIYFLAIS